MNSASELAATLRQLADLSEIRGAATEAADLRRAAGALDTLPSSTASKVPQLARRDRLSEIPAISEAMHWRLRELALGGADAALRIGYAGVPMLLRRLLELGAVSPAEAVSLARGGIVTAADLRAALDEGRAAYGDGELERRLRDGSRALATEWYPVMLGRAWDLCETLRFALRDAVPSLDNITIAGDARRFEPLVEAIVIVARAGDPVAALDAVAGASGIEDVLHRTGRRAVVVFHRTEIDLRVAAPDEYGTVLYQATGGRAHLAAMAPRTRHVRACGREEEVYAQAGLTWVPPELREGGEEIEAAIRGRIPRLVTRDDIRGDLHLHSLYSDGLDSIEGMVKAAVAAGYEYIAITDHSERAGAARTVSPSSLARQRDEIAQLRHRYPAIAILHGIEVDIMPDGRLDFRDEILATLDIVLASLHDGAGHDGRRLTERCLGAIRHPLVNVITHPANQLVGRRAGYPLDYEAVYAAAAETGTALEIDGAPAHLDMDGEHARAAIAAGVTVTIDSDCHRSRALDRQMRLGVGTARRGWVEPRHVLNTRRVADIRAFVAAKRRRA